MKFQGYGIVWDNIKNRALVDFESTATKIGIIDTDDPIIISELTRLGYNIVDANEIINESKIIENIVTEEKKPRGKKKGA